MLHVLAMPGPDYYFARNIGLGCLAVMAIWFVVQTAVPRGEKQRRLRMG